MEMIRKFQAEVCEFPGRDRLSSFKADFFAVAMSAAARELFQELASKLALARSVLRRA
jgi:hypothetical protein